MQPSLSFTIPYTSSAIRATVVALNQMDNDLNGTVGLFESPTRVVGSHTSFPTPSEIDECVTTVFTPPPPSIASAVDEDDLEDESQPEGTVDSAGTPWDARIHSSSKTFLKADGTWKLKKGVDKALVAELMGNVQPPVIAPPVTPTSTTPTNVITPLPPVAPITETPAPVGNGFRQLLSEITKAGLAPEYVQNICREVNGCTLPECKDDMDKLNMLRMSLGL